MGSTIVETNDEYAVKAYSEKVLREVDKGSFFFPYSGKGPDSLMVIREELSKAAGDKVNYQLTGRLTGAGKTGNEQLQDHEEELPIYNDGVTLEQYRHATRRKGRLTKKRVKFAIDAEHDFAIKQWGMEKKEDLCLSALQSAPTRVVYQVSGTFTAASGAGAAATAATAMHAANTRITPQLISQAKTFAKTGGGRRFQPVAPLKIEGKNYHILLVSEDVLNDLRNNSDMITAHREARERDIDNPIFQCTDLFYNGVLIRGWERLGVEQDGGGAAVPYSKCVFMGQQALYWANGEKEDIVMENFDYKNEVGWAWHIVAGVKKPVFNSEDFGSMGFYVSTANVSNA